MPSLSTFDDAHAIVSTRAWAKERALASSVGGLSVARTAGAARATRGEERAARRRSTAVPATGLIVEVVRMFRPVRTNATRSRMRATAGYVRLQRLL